MAPKLKSARQRMSVLELSAKLKNVSEACRRALQTVEPRRSETPERWGCGEPGKRC